ncbi:transketolase [Ureaplasma canigenitalium]|uniref:transketolase n=1 Tax=Ureaplasma canigenitalium TaxID=42092 RepID=UPI0004E11D23|nr:transketolase [Ureaplasma canigenitalium]
MNRYVNAMRSLALQAINHAGSGHMGMAISAAPIFYILYKSLMTISKDHPKWFNRDRMVLSAGHGCMSLYPVFYFANMISLDEIKKFRNGSQIVSGHPEALPNNWIDASTGPLGQGVANSVGMAMAEVYLSEIFSELKGLVNHYTYCVVGDGDIQEGISYEAMSLAGKLGLKKLIVIHDSNDYQLDSKVSDVFTENLEERMHSMNWNYIKVDNNPENIFKAIAEAKMKKNVRPTFIEVKTIIGENLKSENSFMAHGGSVSKEDLDDFHTKSHFHSENFEFHSEIFDHFYFNVVARGQSAYDQWEQLLEQYEQTKPELTQLFKNYINGNFENLEQLLDENKITKLNQSTRAYLKDYLGQLNHLKSCMVLSADLARSTYTKIGEDSFEMNHKAPYVKVGIREHAMAGIANGIMYHSGLKAMSGTFLAFSDYMKPGIRLAALSKLANIFVFSHDSYAVGADGPTHQPIEQLGMLRAIPNLAVYRVADQYELKYALVQAYQSKTKPHCIITSRQNLPAINEHIPNDFKQGAYIVKSQFSFSSNNEFTIIASGSEVSLALEAARTLFEKEHRKVKVISCFELNTFLNQNSNVISNMLFANKKVLVIEASNDAKWYRLLKNTRSIDFILAKDFGESVDGNSLMKKMGFSVENILSKLKE